MPFTFEEANRCKLAEDSLRQISENSDCVFKIQNDIFLTIAPRGSSFTEVMQTSTEYIRKYIELIINIVADKLRDILSKNCLPKTLTVDSSTESILRDTITIHNL